MTGLAIIPYIDYESDALLDPVVPHLLLFPADSILGRISAVLHPKSHLADKASSGGIWSAAPVGDLSKGNVRLQLAVSQSVLTLSLFNSTLPFHPNVFPTLVVFGF